MLHEGDRASRGFAELVDQDAAGFAGQLVVVVLVVVLIVLLVVVAIPVGRSRSRYCHDHDYAGRRPTLALNLGTVPGPLRRTGVLACAQMNESAALSRRRVPFACRKKLRLQCYSRIQRNVVHLRRRSRECCQPGYGQIL